VLVERVIHLLSERPRVAVGPGAAPKLGTRVPLRSNIMTALKLQTVEPSAPSPVEEAVPRSADDLVPLILEKMNEGERSRIEAGRLLFRAKKQVRHGEWKRWLEKNFVGKSHRTANRCMEEAKLANPGEFGPPRKARAPRPPKQTRPETEEDEEELPDLGLCRRLIESGYKNLVDEVKLPALDFAREYLLAFVPEAAP
jgi:hypothetical protein